MKKSCALAVILCLFWPLSWVNGFDTGREEYAARLIALLKAGAMEQGEQQVKVLHESQKAFVQFAEEYPRSIYADDSRFVYSLIEFMGAALVPPRDMQGAQQMIVMMEQMVSRYPAGRLEPATYSILAQEFGDEGLTGAFYIPYRCIVTYMQALMSSQTRDYKNAIARYNELKESLQPIIDERIAAEVYPPLYRAYINSERSRDAQAVIDEVSRAFPGSELETMLRN